jgi:hypothetical protein
MSWVVKVLVRLADGTFTHGDACVYKQDSGEPEVLTKPSAKEAHEWAKTTLPERVIVIKDPSNDSLALLPNNE